MGYLWGMSSPVKQERHYFHGDVVQEPTDNPNAIDAIRHWPGQVIVFCRACDAFEPSDVVRAHPPGMRALRRGSKIVEVAYDGPARLALDKKMWREKRLRGRWCRPADAPNIFET